MPPILQGDQTSTKCMEILRDSHFAALRCLFGWYPNSQHPENSTDWISKMMIWKRYLLTKKAIWGIYVEFQGVHSLKLTWPLKIGHPKRKVIFQPSIFRGYVSFREGSSLSKRPRWFFILHLNVVQKTTVPKATAESNQWCSSNPRCPEGMDYVPTPQGEPLLVISGVI